jgi:hypothetical protein
MGGVGAHRSRGERLTRSRQQLAAVDATKPLLYQCCGSEDFLLSQNRGWRDPIFVNVVVLSRSERRQRALRQGDCLNRELIARGRTIADRPGTGSGS